MIKYTIDDVETKAYFKEPWSKSIIYTISKQFGKQYLNGRLKRILLSYINSQPWDATVSCKDIYGETFDTEKGKKMVKAKLLKRYYNTLNKCYEIVFNYHHKRLSDLTKMYAEWSLKAENKIEDNLAILKG